MFSSQSSGQPCLEVVTIRNVGTDLIHGQASYFILGVSGSNSPPYFEYQFPLLPLSRLPNRDSLSSHFLASKIICQATFLKGKVICWNLSQTIRRKEPSKVIGHVCRERDVLFPDTAIVYVLQHITNNFLVR